MVKAVSEAIDRIERSIKQSGGFDSASFNFSDSNDARSFINLQGRVIQGDTIRSRQIIKQASDYIAGKTFSLKAGNQEVTKVRYKREGEALNPVNVNTGKSLDLNGIAVRFADKLENPYISGDDKISNFGELLDGLNAEKVSLERVKPNDSVSSNSDSGNTKEKVEKVRKEASKWSGLITVGIAVISLGALVTGWVLNDG